MSGHQPKTPEGQAELESARVEPLSNLDLSLYCFLPAGSPPANAGMWLAHTAARNVRCAGVRHLWSVSLGSIMHNVGQLARGPKSLESRTMPNNKYVLVPVA